MKKILAILAILTLGACATDLATNTYQTSGAGRVNSVAEGIIINVRPVRISDDNGTVGTLAGGLGGGVLGSNIGGGSTAHTLGAIGGAVLGGYIGQKTQSALSGQTGYEYIVKLDSGKAITLVQGKNEVFSVGQRVYVLDAQSGERARIIAQY